MMLRGLPPRDILPDVVRAWQSAGLDVAECLQRATTITNEWIYTPGNQDVRERFTPRLISERTVPVAHRDLYEVIDPQPKALVVIRRLLEWIGSCDMVDIYYEFTNHSNFNDLQGILDEIEPN